MIDKILLLPQIGGIYNVNQIADSHANFRGNSQFDTVEINSVGKYTTEKYLKEAVNILYEKGIRSILVEAGGKLNKAFIAEKLPDKLIHFLAPKILGDETGISFVSGFEKNNMDDCNNLKVLSTKHVKNDIIVISQFIY